jgi:hypothetical protein
VTGSIRSAAVALALALVACREPSELARPASEVRNAVLDAVRAYLPEGARAKWVVQPQGAGEPRTIEVVEIGGVSVVRSRLYRVEARGVDAEGRAHPIHFYVVQTGPVFVVDTAVIPWPSLPPYAP